MMQQQLAFIDPTGRVYIMGETNTLPPLAEDYEWTFVMRPVHVADVGHETVDDADQEEPHTSSSRGHASRSRGGVLDLLIPLLTPNADQSPQERAQELIDALPEDIRDHLTKLISALAPPR